jgi:hypothetical protein
MKSESLFLQELEKKAMEQRKIVETEILPSWAKGVGEWLVVHPWRLVMPMALLAYGVWRMVYGEEVREIVLGLFGGFS